ncbi:MAG: hypothetical protein RLZZ196_1552 [Bacteroidota bacterium]|jgi:hypothetical protein
MNYNYTLKYRSFDSLLEDVRTDLRSIATDGVIEPAQLIKIAMKVNYDLGLRIQMTKEKVLEIDHGHARLPDDFQVMNFALICGEYSITTQVPQGTNIQEVVPSYKPWVEASTCAGTTLPPESTCLTKCGTTYSLIQVVGTETRTYNMLTPLRFKNAYMIDCDCPNLNYKGKNEGYIKDGFIFTNLDTGHLYINYQGSMENDNGELLVVDHPVINEYYEYALKKRVLENMIMDGNPAVVNQFQLVSAELRGARNNALSIVNTPNFSEMQKVWAMNRKAMYSKYYDMFKSVFHPTQFNINNVV